MSRGSSFNIQWNSRKNRGMKNGLQIGYLKHNSREIDTANSIFEMNEETVQFRGTAKGSQERFEKWIAPRIKAYEDRTRQKLQSRTILHASSVFNLEAHHTMQDVTKVAKYIEKTFDTKILQIALHRDEGHRVKSEDGLHTEEIVNDHAHVEFLGLDSKGHSIRRKAKISLLSQMQTDIANILGMRRGKKNKDKTPEERETTKRLKTYEYKRAKAKETKIIKEQRARIRKLEQQIKDQAKEFRAELQAKKAIRADYAEVEQMMRETKDIFLLQNMEQNIAYMLSEDFFEQFSQLREKILKRIEDRKTEQMCEAEGLDPAKLGKDVKIEMTEEKPKKELYYGRFEKQPTLKPKAS